MSTPEDIRRMKGLSGEQRLLAQQAMQQDELSYLAALAFEQFEVGPAELTRLNQQIDRRSGGKGPLWQAVLIGLFIGLFIGISIFFVIFHKNQTHPSVYQPIVPDEPRRSPNRVIAADTVFPEPIASAIPKEAEHFSSVKNQPKEPMIPMEAPEPMNSKPVSLPESEPGPESDLLFSFSPNAPVVFISNLKVTNYRLYYFKQSRPVDLSLNTGLAAQYESKANVETMYTHPSENYMAHKIVQRAMKLFSGKRYTECIEELNLLYEFNPRDANAQFYLGMCFYLTGKYSNAQGYFQKNLDNENNIFHQESDFYQALCFLQSKQTEIALARLQTIADAKGFYSTRAQDILARQK